MQGLSERQYAAHAGVSRGAVQKARAAGRLVLFPDGSINVAASDVRRAAMTDPAKSRRPEPPAASHMKPVPEVAVGAVRETLKEHGEPVPASGPMTFLQARTANEVLKAQERRLRLQKLKGEVVDRARATALVFRLARQERDAWLNWPSRISAVMAAELGVDAGTLHTALEKFVREHLGELSEIRPNLR
ncbi:MAG: hypothetical protein HQL34_00760 [Alphaproteobacteria bacterium]|nr:hypothetical protein [Alphaproteobacteria bacterium]